MSLSGCAGVQFHKLKKYDTAIKEQRDYYSSINILKREGKPDEINILKTGDEEWVYYNDIHFSGVVVYLIIPVLPLLIPTGYHTYKYTMRDGYAINLKTNMHRQTFYGERGLLLAH